MTVSTKNFSTLVSDQATAIQSKAQALIDFTPGSLLLAAVEANAAQGLWLQSLVLQVLLLTRASTSTGTDLDSFVNDYGLTRDAAIASTYNETFSRFTDTASAYIPVGAQVQTADGTQTYAVIADPTNPAYDGSAGYNLPAGTASLNVLVQNISGGVGGNVAANTISVLLTAIPGVDTVTNASGTPVTSGQNAETDAALRVRFQDFLASLASATNTAIKTAVNSVQAGLTCSINGNVNPDGSSHPGYITIIVDDGSGNPPTSVLNAVSAAVANTVAEGVTFGVFGPTLVTANVAMTVTVQSGYSHSTIATAIQSAVNAFINGTEFQGALIYTRLFQVIYDASEGIAEVSGLLVNGGTADIVATGSQIIRAGTVTVS